jgi:hypothetical protein
LLGLPKAARKASTVPWIEAGAFDPPAANSTGAAATGPPAPTVAAVIANPANALRQVFGLNTAVAQGSFRSIEKPPSQSQDRVKIG